MEPEEWRDLALITVGLGTFLDVVIVPWLLPFDVLFLALMIYAIVRLRKNSTGP